MLLSLKGTIQKKDMQYEKAELKIIEYKQKIEISKNSISSL